MASSSVAVLFLLVHHYSPKFRNLYQGGQAETAHRPNILDRSRLFLLSLIPHHHQHAHLKQTTPPSRHEARGAYISPVRNSHSSVIPLTHSIHSQQPIPFNQPTSNPPTAFQDPTPNSSQTPPTNQPSILPSCCLRCPGPGFFLHAALLHTDRFFLFNSLFILCCSPPLHRPLLLSIIIVAVVNHPSPAPPSYVVLLSRCAFQPFLHRCRFQLSRLLLLLRGFFTPFTIIKPSSTAVVVLPSSLMSTNIASTATVSVISSRQSCCAFSCFCPAASSPPSSISQYQFLCCKIRTQMIVDDDHG